MRYFQFNIGDYASHTRHLSPMEDLAYRRLLDLAYVTELPLDKDIRNLSRLINLREFQQEISDVLAEFFFESETGWINNRVIKEIEKTGEKSEKARDSIAKRWAKNHDKNTNVPKNDTNVSSDEYERITNVSENDTNVPKNDTTHNTIPITHNTRHKKPLALTRFADFWIQYPRKADKAKAEQSWSKQSLDNLADDVIRGAVSYAKSKIGTEPQFIALPSTWLNGKRWQDETIIQPPDTPPPKTEKEQAELTEREKAERIKYQAQHEARMKKLLEGMKQ